MIIMTKKNSKKKPQKSSKISENLQKLKQKLQKNPKKPTAHKKTVKDPSTAIYEPLTLNSSSFFVISPSNPFNLFVHYLKIHQNYCLSSN
jgi:hypothetical protein